MEKYGVVDGVKGSRQIKEAETGDMLARGGTDEMVVKSQESSFSGMVFGVGGLEHVKE